MNDINTLIVPDIHCRDYWKTPVDETLKQHPDADVVFLGDYLDPYPFEWENGKEILPEIIDNGFKNLKKIIQLSKKHKNIHLLVGNHDASYIGPIDVCHTRHDYWNDAKNRKLFWSNHKQFNIVFEKNINNKQFMFSHAGFINDWVEYNDVFFESVINKKCNITDFLNNKFQLTFENDGNNEDFDYFWNIMSLYDKYRGELGLPYASIIWTDVRTHIDNKKKSKNDEIIQIFGHTYLSTDYLKINNNRYCLDSQQCFYLDNDGNVRNYNSDEII